MSILKISNPGFLASLVPPPPKLTPLIFQPDSSFNTNGGFSDSSGNRAKINSLAVYPNDKIVVVGEFTNYGSAGASNIIKLNVDGSKDTTFDSYLNSGFSPRANYVSIQPSSTNLLVSGLGDGGNWVKRLDSSGGVLNTYLFNANVYTHAVDADGKILVGGGFTADQYGSTGNKGMARIGLDGYSDSSFNLGTGFSAPYNLAIQVIKVQQDGKILVGGFFNDLNGTYLGNLVRLNTDGSKDNTFNTGSGFGGDVTSIAIQSDGKILVGGNFSIYNGTPCGRIVRLNYDGSLDTTFVTSTYVFQQVSEMYLQSDGKVLVGGNMFYNNFENNFTFCRLNSDGSLDAGAYISNYTVGAIDVQSDGKVLIGGPFDNGGLFRFLAA